MYLEVSGSDELQVTWCFLQVPTDLEAKEDGFHQRKIAREVMVLK